MKLMQELWSDDSGAIVSAELVLLGTLGAVGATVGLSALGHSMNAELDELSLSLRSLDQSYQARGFRGQGSWTAGSGYIQPPVEQAHAELREFVAREQEVHQRAIEERDAEKLGDEPGERWDGDESPAQPMDDDAI